jgi:hypothetical protein
MFGVVPIANMIQSSSLMLSARHALTLAFDILNPLLLSNTPNPESVFFEPATGAEMDGA